MIRPATRDDVSAVHDIARESWHAAYDDFLGADTVDETIDEWYAHDRLEDAVLEATDRSDAVFLVALGCEQEGSREPEKTVGFAHAASHPEKASVAYLIRIYVVPDSWGEGHGRALLERVESALEDEFDSLRLTVLADNAVGVSFYESTGFDRVETRETDLGEGLEEYVYEKRL